MSSISAVLNGVSVGLAYVVNHGNITATIIWFGIATGVTAGLSYNKEQEELNAQSSCDLLFGNW